jgi:uncharacterized membrane protein YgdD (TMEM256/DUF423 family)
MERKILIVAAIFGMVAIVLGAFGAHALKKVLAVEALTSFETGVRYQMYHALFLLFIANSSLLGLKEKTIVFYLVTIGVLLFSGSIYLLSTSVITGLKTKILGPITPIGGMFLIASWGYFLYALILKNTN